MAKLLYKPKQTVSDKFRKAQTDLNNQLSLNKEQRLNKLMHTSIAPIIEHFYVADPIIKSKKIPYYETKTFDKGIKKIRQALKGTLFNDTEFKAYAGRKFTVDEIVDSIMIHKKAMLPQYRPQDKKYLRVSLDQFLYNPYASSIGKSFLIYWMRNDPIPVMTLETDFYSDVTAELIALFAWDKLSFQEKNQVIKGVAHYMEILKGYNFSPVHRITPKLKAQILYELLTKLFSFVGVPVQPVNMVSPKFESWVRKGLEESQYIL